LISLRAATMLKILTSIIMDRSQRDASLNYPLQADARDARFK